MEQYSTYSKCQFASFGILGFIPYTIGQNRKLRLDSIYLNVTIYLCFVDFGKRCGYLKYGITGVYHGVFFHSIS